MRKEYIAMSCVLIAGCATDPVGIEGKDDEVVFSEMDVVIALKKKKTATNHKTVNSISIGAAYGKGEFKQEIQDGEHANVNGVQFDGPLTLESKGNLGVFNARYNHHFDIGGCFEWYLSGGLGYLNMHYTGTSRALEGSKAKASFVPHIEVGAICNLTPSFSIEAGSGHYGRLVTNSNQHQLIEQHLRLNYQPVDWLRFFVGFRYWDYYLDQDDSIYTQDLHSEINFEYSGPTVGLSLRF
jgi:hypothetical protein